MIEKYSPQDIAAALQKVGAKVYDPTPEQSAIISIATNPLEPAVVIAGAGSGKTETMAARVIYLVANGFARPDQILGLTFTRKAAGELAVRIRTRLRQLRAAGLIPENTPLEVSVTTYHSYAARLLSEHSIRFGIDADISPMGDAAMWQLANDVVRNWDDATYTNESAINTVVDDLLGLTKLMLEHQVKPDAIEAADLVVLQELSTMSGDLNDQVRRVNRVLTQRIGLLPMVASFIERRQQSGQLSFDDQMSLAADIAVNFADVGELERAKYSVVLLDEYQDTSQSQVRMLSSLFGAGHPVMAVGDPCQAIYTWRGASAGTINSFHSYFPKVSGQSGAERYSLLTTFRNDRSILQLANVVSSQIRAEGGADVPPLTPRPDAGPGNLVCGVFETIDAEAQAVADYFAPLWFDEKRLATSTNKRTTFAVLVRKRSQIASLESALRSAGMPVDVIGLGGLIHVPEVADIVSMLKVIADPDAGAALMRHLTGPRINLGAKDLAALGAYSRNLAKGSCAESKSLIKKIAAGNPERAEADDQFLGSLIDTLDEIEKSDRKTFTEVGYNRLKVFAADLRRLRSRAGGTITDLINEIENYLALEEEVMLRDGTGSGRRHIDRFLDEAGKFARSGGTLSSFLQWLDITGEEEGGLKSAAPEVRSDVVQILTVHMSKGAEWDVVAVPGLAEGTFPGINKSDPDNWITNEKHIPFQLRGDRAELPHFSFNGATKNSEAKKAIDAYGKICNATKVREEIRLGYVAFTRARTHLMATTSWWRDGADWVAPSSIFEQVALVAQSSGEILNNATQPEGDAKNPKLENPETGIWPRDPLGEKRAEFDSKVKAVQSASPIDLNKFSDTDLEVTSWVDDAKALINEVNRARSGGLEIALPPRLSTSTLVALHKDPAELALNIRRPMPRPQDEYSRRGTAFHLWIERHFMAATLFDDDDLDFLDPLEPDQTLDDLKAKWLASEWAPRIPVAVEVPFEAVIGPVLVRGRIDTVYEINGRYEVIDWKTGSTKLGPSSAVQLAVYRLAWAKLKGIDPAQVSAAFHYVPSGQTDRSADLLTETELIKLLSL
ncbi:UvrD Superfamily I DNA and RNA helicases [Candidatus Nanopelagicaceae bacterium]